MALSCMPIVCSWDYLSLQVHDSVRWTASHELALHCISMERMCHAVDKREWWPQWHMSKRITRKDLCRSTYLYGKRVGLHSCHCTRLLLPSDDPWSILVSWWDGLLVTYAYGEKSSSFNYWFWYVRMLSWRGRLLFDKSILSPKKIRW